MFKIDLHIHSNISDGALSSKEIIDLAIKKNIPAIAITDHNDARGIEEALEYAKGKNIEVISGIEITVTPPKDSRELHIVGLFIDHTNKEILNILEKCKKHSIDTAKKIIKKINDLGYGITFQELLNETNGKHFSKPFIAKILMRKYPLEFTERREVFAKLLGQQGKAFVKAIGVPLKEAIEIIHNAGGIAIIAHPWYLRDNMEKTIRDFSKLGGDGIEIDYVPKETIPEETKEILKQIAKEENLVISGGTDFHEIKEGEKEIGDQGISPNEFKSLKKYFSTKTVSFK